MEHCAFLTSAAFHDVHQTLRVKLIYRSHVHSLQDLHHKKKKKKHIL